MPKRSRKKRPTDPNELAKAISDEATAAADPESEPVPTPPAKNPAAVALGSLGGKKGGPARAKKLSEARRKAIARKAAKARWSKKA